MLVSVVCPFFNEAAIIAAAIGRLTAQLQGLGHDWELVLVDDGSTDDGLAIAVTACEELGHGCVNVLSYPFNRGRGHALRTGLGAATGEIIVTTEIDLSWGLDIVRLLVDALTAHADANFVVASPHCKQGGFEQVPLPRVLVSRWGNRALALILGLGVTMHTGMTRAYRREVIKPLRTNANGKEFHLEVLLKLITLGFSYREIPVTLSWRFRQDQAQPRRAAWRVPLRTIGSHLLFLAVSRPIRIFGVLSGLSLAASVGFIIFTLVQILTGGVAIFGALVALLMLLFSLLFLGFAGVFSQIMALLGSDWAAAYPRGHLQSDTIAKSAWPREG